MVLRLKQSAIACIAFAADESMGSEAGAGAALVAAAGQRANQTGLRLIVYTRTKHALAVNRQLQRLGVEHETVAIDGVKVFEGNPSASFRIESLVWQMRVRSDLVKRIDGGQVVIVHHMTLASDSIPGAIHFLGRERSVRKVWGPVGSSSVLVNTGTSVRARALRLAKVAVFSALSSRVDHTVCMSGWVQKQKRWGAGTVSVEPNCLVAEDLLQLVRASKMRVPNGRTEGDGKPLRVAAVGLLGPRKRPALICAAAAVAKGEWVLTLVGDGQLRAQLEHIYRNEIAQGWITFTGNLPRPEAVSLLAGCDVLAHMSSREGSPWAVAEALTLDLKIISVRGGGADELCRTTPGAVYRVLADVDAHDPVIVSNAVRELGALSPSATASNRFSADRFGSLMEQWYR